ncbi:MAG: glycosyltransferase family 4 protein [Pseudomonadota bacterium]
MAAPAPPLLIAEAANPEFVSVPLEGWSQARALQQRTGGHIVTQVRNRAAFVRAGLLEGRDFTAIDSEAIARPVAEFAEKLRMGQGKGWTTTMAMSALSYPYFERLVWQRFERALAAGTYSLVHRITPLSPTLPSPIASRLRRLRVPFVMGPMNGGLPWPAGFDAERRREREYLSYVRGAYRALPGYGATLRAASAIIAGSRHTAASYPKPIHRKIVYIPENGVDPERFALRPRPAPGAPLRACFVGRLVPYKGPDMLIAAAAPVLRQGRMVLDIVGGGPMEQALRQQAASEGVAEAITFHGQIPHAQVQDVLGAADLFAFPSVREFGGAVVLEAMAMGAVPIVVAYGGPGEHVTDTTGFRIPIGSRASIVDAMRARLTAIAGAPDCLSAMSDAGVARVGSAYTWARKAEQIERVYDWARDGRQSARPDPFVDSV